MTIALMIFATVAAYAAGIATMLVVASWRSTLAKPIPPHWLPQIVTIEPPPKQSAPTARSPFAPRPKPEPRKRLLHWPRADAWAERNLTATATPDSPPSVSLLPHNEL